jgi:excinuclease ABC subunit B
LREGLDLPEVSLVAVMDADKEGFLRSHRSLTQTAGRAARNLNGRVIMYADKITDSMRKTIDETNRRREKQLKYNQDNNVTPTQISRSKESIIKSTAVAAVGKKIPKVYVEPELPSLAADPVVAYMNSNQLEKSIAQVKAAMEKAARKMEFMEAARLRDEMFALQKQLDEKKI